MEETNQVVVEEEQPVEKKTGMLPLERAAKIIALVIFPLVLSAAIGAVVSDIVIFASNILMFFVACLGAVAAFIIGFVLMIVSIVFIFGIYLLEEYGFWPITWTASTFTEILADAKITPEQVQILLLVRI